jgi:hypothetical protein
MQRWSEEHQAFAVETFFKNNDFATVTRRVFRLHFGIGRNGKVPTRHTLLNWVTQFRYWSAENPHVASETTAQ